MKLDTKAMRHLAAEDWRVLAAVEQGTKNHDLVPTPVIEKLSRLRGGPSSVTKSISALAKTSLIGKVKEAKYDGYRLTYGGIDYLALHAYAQQNVVYSVGTRIGVGKESDIVMVADHSGTQKVLKIHRLGRISFRTVKSNRDYLRKSRGQGQGGSWMYLSKLAAMKEYAFMKALREEGFDIPEPISQNRHTIVMAFIDSFPLRQVSEVGDPAGLYADLIGLILRLAKHGLIHGDFNEFNILIREERSTSKDEATGTEEETIKVTPVLIDFPQMVSMEHANAEVYFDRDVNCIKRFFERRFHFTSTQPGPYFKDAKKTVGKDGARRLDAAVEASGFTKKMLKDLEAAIAEQLAGRGEEGEQHATDEEEEEDEEDEDEDESDISDEEEPKAGHSSGTTEDSSERIDISKLSLGNKT
ncbi:RIO1 family protein [Apiospora kogelbergensis]|uniref:Serine/threonine-protein kinase RIO2 n=1 Tax=Apiospora kogelbergensis TaxID=1337665 RepID=A0AAW0QHD0_9PEZI